MSKQWRGKTKVKQLFSPLNLAFDLQLFFSVQVYFVAVKGSDKLPEWGKYCTNKPRNEAALFNWCILFFTLSGEKGIFFLLLNLCFYFIIHTVVLHCRFRNLRCIERILEVPLDLCVYVADILYIVNKKILWSILSHFTLEGSHLQL